MSNPKHKPCAIFHQFLDGFVGFRILNGNGDQPGSLSEKFHLFPR